MVITLRDDVFSVFDPFCGETYNFPNLKGFHFYRDATLRIAPTGQSVALCTMSPPPTAGIGPAVTYVTSSRIPAVRVFSNFCEPSSPAQVSVQSDTRKLCFAKVSC